MMMECSGGAKRKRSNAREIDAGQFYRPLSDNLMAKMLQGLFPDNRLLQSRLFPSCGVAREKLNSPYVQYAFVQRFSRALQAEKMRLFADGVYLKTAPRDDARHRNIPFSQHAATGRFGSAPPHAPVATPFAVFRTARAGSRRVRTKPEYWGMASKDRPRHRARRNIPSNSL